MKRTRRRQAIALAMAGAVGCAAFPENLLDQIPVDAGDVAVVEASTDSSVEATPSDAGDARPPICAAERCPMAELVVNDLGAHRALVAISDRIVWSTSGATENYDVKYCLPSNCSVPSMVHVSVCSNAQTMTGYLAAVGAGVVMTNPGCTLYLFRLDPTADPGDAGHELDGAPIIDTDDNITAGHGDNERYVRIIGDSTGMFATVATSAARATCRRSTKTGSLTSPFPPDQV
jgi:hypothetical protein